MFSNTNILPPAWRALIRSGIVSILVLACGSGTGEEAGVPDPGAAGEARTPPSLSEIGNSTIAGIYDDPIRLTGAVYEGETFVAGGTGRPRVQLLDTYLTGDLDGAPGDEAVVVLVEDSGGSGSFAYVAVMSRNDGGVVNLATTLLGDRVQVRAARVQNGTVVVDLLQAGPEGPLCCPGEPATRTWRLVDGALREVPPDGR